MATIAATASFHRALDRASHPAIGVPMIRSKTVAMAASSSVSRIGDHSSAKLSIATPSPGRAVAELLDHANGILALEEVEKGTRSRALLAGLQQHGILQDRLMIFGGHHPARA